MPGPLDVAEAVVRTDRAGSKITQIPVTLVEAEKR